jgi:hypothetical protein
MLSDELAKVEVVHRRYDRRHRNFRLRRAATPDRMADKFAVQSTSAVAEGYGGICASLRRGKVDSLRFKISYPRFQTLGDYGLWCKQVRRR